MPKSRPKTRPKASPKPRPAKPARKPLPGAPLIEGAIDRVSLDDLALSPFNPRQHPDNQIAALAGSIHTNGVLQNLIVNRSPDGKLEVLAGQRRYKALLRLAAAKQWDAAFTNIPVRIVSGSESELRAIGLLENLQREDLEPLDEARGFKALRELKIPAAEIAKRIGKTARHVQLRLELLDKLQPEVQEALDQKTISLAHARALTVAAPKEQKKLLTQVKANDWSVRDAERLRERLTQDLPRVSAAVFDRKRYTGAVVEIPAEYGGKPSPRFADKAQFWVLQDEAIKARKAALEKRFAFVEMRKGAAYLIDHHYVKSGDKKKAGAVIAVDSHGAVAVRTGLVKRPAARAGGAANYADRQKQQEAGEAKRDAKRKAARTLLDKLRPSIAGNATLGLRLLLLRQLDQTPNNEAKKDLEQFSIKLSSLNSDSRTMKTWAALQHLNESQLVHLAAIMASHNENVGYSGGFDPVQKSLLHTFGITADAPAGEMAPTADTALPAKAKRAAGRKSRKTKPAEDAAAAPETPATVAAPTTPVAIAVEIPAWPATEAALAADDGDVGDIPPFLRRTKDAA